MRCPEGILFAVLLPGGIIEVKCRSNRCGAAPGVLVLHRFDALTAELVETKKYRDHRGGQDDGNR